MHYMVFASVPYGNGVQWNPVGVYEAPDVDSACKIAARNRGIIGTYFAVEGSPWGLSLEKIDGVSELGRSQSLSDIVRERAEIALERERLERDRWRAQLNAADSHEATSHEEGVTDATPAEDG